VTSSVRQFDVHSSIAKLVRYADGFALQSRYVCAQRALHGREQIRVRRAMLSSALSHAIFLACLDEEASSFGLSNSDPSNPLVALSRLAALHLAEPRAPKQFLR